jgi:hypothetical protein
VSIYSDDDPAVNAEVDAAETLPRFLPPRRKRAASGKPRRRIRPEVGGSLRAAIAKKHQALLPNSPRIKPTLPKLRLREPA